MQTDSQPAEQPGNRLAFKLSEETLLVSRPELLEMIQKLKTADSLLSLTEGVFVVKQLLSALESDLVALPPGAAEDTIELGQEFLLGALNQIARSQTTERAKYYLERLERGIKETKTSKINDINLNRWKEYDINTESLWLVERRDNSGVHSAGYWGNFIPQIPNQMLRRYTKGGEWVLDAFAGCGTTLIESQRLGRNGIGIELQPSVVQKARTLIDAEPNKQAVVSEIVTADSTVVDYEEILAKYGQKSVQLLIMHPPYFDIIKFSDHPRDLSNAGSVERFLVMLRAAVENAMPFLDKGRYFALIIADKYAKGEWIPLGFQAMNEVLGLGFSLKSIVVKNFEETTGKRQQKELWKYRALVGGFYIFKHEYIFLFRKK